MTTRTANRRCGFTLVEMLVVITIIGILAAILLPAIWGAVVKARENVIAQEMAQLSMQIEDYKNTYTEYPPDFSDSNPSVTNNLWYYLSSNARRHLRKAFPRNTEIQNVLIASVPTQVISNGTMSMNGGYADPTAPVTGGMTLPTGVDASEPAGSTDLSVRFKPGQLDPSEAIPFWLGMVKNNPRQPLNGTGDFKGGFEFDQTRLVDLDDDGWLSYVPKFADESPYLYFVSDYDNSGTAPSFTWTEATGSVTIYPYKRLTANTTNVADLNNATTAPWASPKSFQIISAGLDNEFGAVSDTTSVYKGYPFGVNYNDDGADKDNITSFSDGKPLRDQMD